MSSSCYCALFLKSCLFSIVLKLFYIKIKFCCVSVKIPPGCGDVNRSYIWWWKPFSIPVSSKKALKGLLIWCSLKMTFALCKFSVKRSDSPWMWSWQLPRPTVPLRQAAFVFKRFKELKVGSVGWHVSWWPGTLIANTWGGCQVGGVECFCVHNLRGMISSAGWPLFWQAYFEYHSFLGI